MTPVVALMMLSGIVSTATSKPRQLPRRVVNLVLKDTRSRGCSEGEIAIYKRNIKFELYDLNGDKVPEVFAYIDHRDWCGMSFNCEYWVFQRRRKHYRMLVGGYPVLRVADTITNGFSDLESQGYLGACVLPGGTMGRSIYLTVFKYTGNEYKPTVVGERCRERKVKPSSSIPELKLQGY